MTVDLTEWIDRFLSCYISLIVTMVLLFLMEFFITELLRTNEHLFFSNYRLILWSIFSLAGFIPLILGSYLVESEQQPFGVLGSTMGSVLNIFLWIKFYKVRHIWLLGWLASRLRGDPFIAGVDVYGLYGFFGGFIGYILKKLRM